MSLAPVVSHLTHVYQVDSHVQGIAQEIVHFIVKNARTVSQKTEDISIKQVSPAF